MKKRTLVSQLAKTCATIIEPLWDLQHQHKWINLMAPFLVVLFLHNDLPVALSMIISIYASALTGVCVKVLVL